MCQGNLCDSLPTSQPPVEKEAEAVAETSSGGAAAAAAATAEWRLPKEMLSRFVEAGIAASSDNDKVRANAMRTLGNLALLLEPGLETNDQQVAEIIAALIRNIGGGSVKVRWNACRALRNAMVNPKMPLASAPWRVCFERGGG